MAGLPPAVVGSSPADVSSSISAPAVSTADDKAPKPKTKKVRMPDGTIKVKVQAADGTWKWQKAEGVQKRTPSLTVQPLTAAGTTSTNSDIGVALSTDSTARKASANKVATSPRNNKPASSKAAATKPPKSNFGRNVGHFFQAAKVLDAVLPEHLKLGHDLAEDMGMHSDDNNNSDNNSISSNRGNHGPSSASSKQLAKLAASGMKVKVKKAKKSVYRTDEVGSSDEEEIGTPASSADKINSIKEKTVMDEKAAFEVEEKEIKPLKKRPSKGRKLQRRTSRLAQGVAWSIALFFPLLFLILAIINATMNGKDATEGSKHRAFATRLLQADKVCVSMWPILFGAIVAQSLKMYAAWRVERGIKLIQLEQFIGSHSLATAIKQPFFLQTINWTAIGMICLWALSPIAGQSFLRMLTIDNRHFKTNATISFSNYAKPLTTPWDVSSNDTSNTEINLIFAAAQLTPSGFANGNVATDVWSNPILAMTPTDYHHVGAYSFPYAVVGQPFWNRPGMDYTASYSNYTFFAPYSYFSFVCDDPYNTTIDELVASTPTLFNPEMSDSFTGNDTTHFGALWADSGESAWMASVPSNGVFASNGSGPATLYYAMNHKLTDLGEVPANTSDTWSDEVAVWKCSYFTQYTLNQYQCWNGGNNCVIKDGNVTNTRNGTNVYLTDTFIIDFLDSMGTPWSTKEGQQFRSLLSQSMLWGGGFEDNNETPDPSTVDGYHMAMNLMQLINAYWQLGFSYNVIRFGGDNDTVVPNLDHVEVFIDNGSPVYSVHWAWFVVLVCSCLMLLVFGAVGIFLDSQTIGPDVLGFASSLTRDNRYIKLEDDDVELGEVGVDGASTKNAYETMKDLKNHKVMLQDVRGHQDVGKIALGSVGLANGKPLNRERLYR